MLSSVKKQACVSEWIFSRPSRFGLDDAAGRLGRRVLDRRGLVAPLEDVVGLGEPLLDVAEAHPPAVVVLVDEVVRAVRLDHRRAVGDRLLDVEHGRQVLVGDLHRGRALARGALGGRHDGDDRLAQ